MADDALGNYLNQIGSIPRLTLDEEIKLSSTVQAWLAHPEPVPRRVERLGRRAKDRIIKGNLRLAVRVAKRYQGIRGVEFLDLIQAANLGLIRAAEKFDSARGYRFSTYGYWWIRQGITRFLERHGHQVSMPGIDASRIARLESATRKLRLLLKREPSIDELADELEITPSHLSDLLAVRNRCISLDAPVTEDGKPLLNVIEGDQSEVNDDDDAAERLAARMAALPERYQRVLAGFWGIGREAVSCAALAREEGCSVARMKAALAAAEDMLRNPSRPAPQILEAAVWGECVQLEIKLRVRLRAHTHESGRRVTTRKRYSRLERQRWRKAQGVLPLWSATTRRPPRLPSRCRECGCNSTHGGSPPTAG